MLAQHLITRPVFDALFEGYSFAESNPVSQAMQAVLATLNEHNLAKEAESLAQFYASVKRGAEGIDSATAKQKIIVELYDKFFQNTFPKVRDKLGIVYMPVKVVDFIIHSVTEVLRSEYGQTLGSPGVHILDPFTGTGTFITACCNPVSLRRRNWNTNTGMKFTPTKSSFWPTTLPPSISRRPIMAWLAGTMCRSRGFASPTPSSFTNRNATLSVI